MLNSRYEIVCFKPHGTEQEEGATMADTFNPSSVSRISVIVHGADGRGLEYESYDLSEVTYSIQDDGRTLKIFAKREASKTTG
jgi:hypothetical protein